MEALRRCWSQIADRMAFTTSREFRGKHVCVFRFVPVADAKSLPEAPLVLGIITAALSGSSSVVECDLAKVEVAGSNPVSRSRFPHCCCRPSLAARVFGVGQVRPRGRGTQVVRERSAKPLCVGSIPTRASKFKGHQTRINSGFFYWLPKMSGFCANSVLNSHP